MPSEDQIIFCFTFSRFILLNVASIDLTTPAMDLVTYWKYKKKIEYSVSNLKMYIVS